LNAGSSVAWLFSGIVFLRIGETDLGIEHIETAGRLDPMGPNRSPQTMFMAMARFEQRRFPEAEALLRDYHHQRETPFSYALLAATHGHLGQTAAALEALDRYRHLTPLPVDEIARGFFYDPSHLQLFMDGIALAEGKAASGDPTGPG